MYDKFKGTRSLAGKTAGQYGHKIILMPTFFLDDLTPASNQAPQLLNHYPLAGMGERIGR